MLIDAKCIHISSHVHVCLQALNKPGSGANCVDAAKAGACANPQLADSCCRSCRGSSNGGAAATVPAASCKDISSPDMEKVGYMQFCVQWNTLD